LIEYGYLAEKEVVTNWIEVDDATEPDIIMTATYTITKEGKALLNKWDLFRY
jgi:hypothetical protein